ncbi:MAG TPA: site-2 protease family protein [Phycisphaerae bacterium]|nr:site-2 protease family protein [Phycisphaerae bacterium]
MLKRRLTLFRLFGIPVRLGVSWLILFAVVFVGLAQSYYTDSFGLSSRQIYLMSLVATILYLGSLLMHEFGHALAAKAFDVPVLSVELFALGGVARMGGFTRRPRDEFVMAAAGPTVSLILAVLFAMAAAVSVFVLQLPPVIVDLWQKVALFNTAIMLFNLLPAYPLDGGRLLQGLLWWLTGRRTLAAGIAAAVGFLLAAALGAVGLFFLLTQGLNIGTVWPIALGGFVATAALGAYRATRNVDRMSAMTAGQAVDPNVQTIDAAASADPASPVVVQTTLPLVLVLDDQHRAAAVMVPPGNPRHVPGADSDWPTALIEPNRRVADSSPLLEAVDRMGRMNTFWLVVEDAQGRYVGTVTTPGLRQMMQRQGRVFP